MAKRLNSIRDKDSGKIVGYTMEGLFDNILIYLDGFGYEDYFHGETGNFSYYCTLYGWNYELVELRDNVPEPTANKSFSKDVGSMTVAEKLAFAIYNLEKQANDYRNGNHIIMHEHDILVALNGYFAQYRMDYIISAYQLTASSHFVGKTILTSVESFCMLVTSAQILNEIKDLPFDVSNSITRVTYDAYSSVCQIDFTISYD